MPAGLPRPGRSPRGAGTAAAPSRRPLAREERPIRQGRTRVSAPVAGSRLDGKRGRAGAGVLRDDRRRGRGTRRFAATRQGDMHAALRSPVGAGRARPGGRGRGRRRLPSRPRPGAAEGDPGHRLQHHQRRRPGAGDACAARRRRQAGPAGRHRRHRQRLARAGDLGRAEGGRAARHRALGRRLRRREIPAAARLRGLPRRGRHLRPAGRLRRRLLEPAAEVAGRRRAAAGRLGHAHPAAAAARGRLHHRAGPPLSAPGLDPRDRAADQPRDGHPQGSEHRAADQAGGHDGRADLRRRQRLQRRRRVQLVGRPRGGEDRAARRAAAGDRAARPDQHRAADQAGLPADRGPPARHAHHPAVRGRVRPVLRLGPGAVPAVHLGHHGARLPRRSDVRDRHARPVGRHRHDLRRELRQVPRLREQPQAVDPAAAALQGRVRVRHRALLRLLRRPADPAGAGARRRRGGR